MSASPSSEARAAIPAGGEHLGVTFADGSTGTVFVRLLPIRLLGAYQLCAEDEASAVELFCDQAKGWADTLGVDSLLAILAKGEALNLDPLSAFVQRQSARREKLSPGIEARILRQLAESATSRAGSRTAP